MERYYKTTGLYDTIDLLKVEVVYDKNIQGYIAEVNPCAVDVHGTETRYYCREYYKYHGCLKQPLVPCGRRSKKQEEKACALCDKMIPLLLEKYIKIAEKKGSQHIEVIGELEELRK